MDNKPLVSVLMTSYNRQQFIAEAIESVLDSTYSNFELIIVDDCSTDDTVAIAQAYQEKDKRVQIFVNEENIGDYPNRNKAASYARGKYLKYVDSDDTIYTDTIEYCVSNMEKNISADMGMAYMVEQISEPVLIESEKALHNHFFKAPFLVIGPGGTILRKSFFDFIKGYSIPFLYRIKLVFREL